MKAPSSNTQLQRYLRHGIMPQLAAFHTVVRMGSVTRAAEEMCVAQPTLSGYLRKLSDTLGVPLFEMRGKRLEPTDAALVLLETVQHLYAALENCEQHLSQLRTKRGSRELSKSIQL
jgi:DNA-binding transcriptional LysR family regulator